MLDNYLPEPFKIFLASVALQILLIRCWEAKLLRGCKHERFTLLTGKSLDGFSDGCSANLLATLSQCPFWLFVEIGQWA